MTAARQKQKRRRIPRIGGRLAGLILLAPWLAVPPAAALTERIVANWHTGLAMDGYDPVGYFTDQKPVPGNADFEAYYAGVVWRFSNPGNRAAFLERPDIYMPQFGGYDPIGVVLGRAVAGSVDVWLIVGTRLYLFHDEGHREKFVADMERLLAEAERQWPSVLHTLSP